VDKSLDQKILATLSMERILKMDDSLNPEFVREDSRKSLKLDVKLPKTSIELEIERKRADDKNS